MSNHVDVDEDYDENFVDDESKPRRSLPLSKKATRCLIRAQNIVEQGGAKGIGPADLIEAILFENAPQDIAAIYYDHRLKTAKSSGDTPD
ncbi:hypothetical protein EEAAV_26840 (plasmid) [Rahnella aceris]